MEQVKKKPIKNATTTQSIASLIKSCRDIMRKDKGLTTDLDRLPMLTWIMFLKFLDDLEQVREAEAMLEGKQHRPLIDPPYRWYDWGAKPDGITGDALIAFIQNDEAILPDGTKGPGLFSYLRSLTGANGGDRRDVIRAVFQGTINRMLNGYLLRDVLNKVNGIHFTSSEEIYTLGHLYESMLKEMRDAAGENGEFYTPRSLVKFIVNVINPQLGEIVLDPACGTGGFLAEAFEHIKKQCKTAEDHWHLQRDTLFGIEAKPLPYLLCQMNLLLHGVETPNIDPLNALRFRLREIGDKDRVDVIITNPPFGGEEERGILGNFPEDKQTTETTALFMQLIMRKLKRPPHPGRAAVVVSDGFLSTRGVVARIKEELLSEFNLHTIVRLPRGVFVPYTPIATNVLFFDRSGPTKTVWYYEVPGPTDRQTYSKTKPFKFEELTDCMKWWGSRVENTHAWQVTNTEIGARDYDLDIINPSRNRDQTHRHPLDLLQSIATAVTAMTDLATKLKTTFSPELYASITSARLRSIGEFLRLRKEFVNIHDSVNYKLLTVQLHARGIRQREEKLGSEIKTKKQQVVREGDLVVAEIDAKLGGFGLVPLECAGAIVSSHYFVYEIDTSIIDPGFFVWWLRSGIPESLIQPYVKGATNYAAIRQHHFPLLEMRLPESVEEQRQLAAELDALQTEVDQLEALQAETASELDALLPAILDQAFKGKL